MKIAFVVGSFITPYKGGSKSVYSVQERIEQTHETLKSIRERCPDATIYFVEGSLTDISECNFDYDVLLRPAEDVEARKILYTKTKSFGECVMMVHAASNVPLEEYDIVFKISGRYVLTDDFNPENFSQETFTFYDHGQWGYETTLYSFPGSLKSRWKEALLKTLDHMYNNKVESIEISFRHVLKVKNIHIASKLGVQGYNAPLRRFIKY